MTVIPNAKLCTRSTIAAALFCLALTSTAAQAADKFLPQSENKRVLAACPPQSDLYEDISPEVDWAGFTERNLVILDLTNTDVHLVSKDNSSPLHHSRICEKGDRYVLIGKDGGVKRRWSGTLLIDDLFQTIDAMPMRKIEMHQYEMRQWNKN